MSYARKLRWARFKCRLTWHRWGGTAIPHTYECLRCGMRIGGRP